MLTAHDCISLIFFLFNFLGKKTSSVKITCETLAIDV